MEKELFVYMDVLSEPVLVGHLWARVKGGRESASFEYSRTWLKQTNRFAIEPALSLMAGPHHTAHKKTIFGAFGDSAPDRWGRMLMRRAERIRAKNKNQTPRSLLEIDYLLGVNDFARQGAIRFSLQEDGPFLAENNAKKIPPLIELPKLLSASEALAQDNASYDDIKLLLAPGSSLGGARPKASVLDNDGLLAIAELFRNCRCHP